MPIYKALITPTVSGGNIEVKISANSSTQAKALIKTLPYFKSFVKNPTVANESEVDSSKLKQIIKKLQMQNLTAPM